MHLLITALLSFSGEANAFCNFPCLSVGIGLGSTIIPDDWFELSYRSLGGELNYYRVEMDARAEFRSLYIGDYELSERNYSREESSDRTSVYYVPARAEAYIRAEGTELLWLNISGAEKPNL